MRHAKVLAAVVVMATCGAATACLYTTYQHHSAENRQRYRVAPPSANASPEQVVLTYLHALDGHDSATARQLVTPRSHVDVPHWLADTAAVRDITVLGTRLDTEYAQESGTPYPQAYEVDTQFRFRAHSWKEDISFPSGTRVWSYFLVQDHGRWLIQDNGQG